VIAFLSLELNENVDIEKEAKLRPEIYSISFAKSNSELIVEIYNDKAKISFLKILFYFLHIRVLTFLLNCKSQ
jgi:hypothetical protein